MVTEQSDEILSHHSGGTDNSDLRFHVRIASDDSSKSMN
jgi:hypothetical protein